MISVFSWLTVAVATAWFFDCDAFALASAVAAAQPLHQNYVAISCFAVPPVATLQPLSTIWYQLWIEVEILPMFGFSWGLLIFTHSSCCLWWCCNAAMTELQGCYHQPCLVMLVWLPVAVAISPNHQLIILWIYIVVFYVSLLLALMSLLFLFLSMQHCLHFLWLEIMHVQCHGERLSYIRPYAVPGTCYHTCITATITITSNPFSLPRFSIFIHFFYWAGWIDLQKYKLIASCL